MNTPSSLLTTFVRHPVYWTVIWLLRAEMILLVKSLATEGAVLGEYLTTVVRM